MTTETVVVQAVRPVGPAPARLVTAMKIGEVARQVGVATSALRFYEEAGLLPEPERTPSAYREYDPSVIDRLVFIRAGQAVGLTLAHLKEVLRIRNQGEAPCRHVTDLIEARIQEVEERIEDLRRLRSDLVGLAATASDFDPALCPPESACRDPHRRPLTCQLHPANRVGDRLGRVPGSGQH